MTLKEENQWFTNHKNLCKYSRKPEKIDESVACDYCGTENTYPWLVCENPNCYEVVALEKQRRKNNF
jgi:hypothetical protein